MEDLEKLKKILNEPITVNNLNRINDYFVRYLFSHTGNEHIAFLYLKMWILQLFQKLKY